MAESDRIKYLRIALLVVGEFIGNEQTNADAQRHTGTGDQD